MPGTQELLASLKAKGWTVAAIAEELGVAWNTVHIWEIGQQRHRDVSARVALHRDQPEQLVDKDNHAWDGLKMFFNRFPPKAMPRKAEQKPNTFQWWRRASQAAQRGEKVGTFRV